MAQYYTVARPYARALFEEAQSGHLEDQWLYALNVLSVVIHDKHMRWFVVDPRISHEDCEHIILEIVNDYDSKISQTLGKSLVQFLRLLITEKRLMVVPDIAYLFHELLSAKKQIKEVEVISAFPLSTDHQQQIKKSLHKRFHSKIDIQNRVDKSLIGGAIIRAGDWVLDNSIKNKLARLSENLMG